MVERVCPGICDAYRPCVRIEGQWGGYMYDQPSGATSGTEAGGSEEWAWYDWGWVTLDNVQLRLEARMGP